MNWTDNENMLHYYNIWRIALRETLGWNEDEVQEWAQKWLPWAAEPHNIFYHDSPGSYIAPLLLPSRLKDKLTSSKEENAILGKLARVLNRSLDESDAIRKAVEDILKPYGESLPASPRRDCPDDSKSREKNDVG